MKLNKYYLRKSLFIKKNEILNNKNNQQEIKNEVQEEDKEKLSVLPEYRSLLGIKRFKPTANGSIKEDIKNISPKN